MNTTTKPSRIEERNGRWAVLDDAGSTMCVVRERKTAEALVGCSFDGERFVRRVAVARAVERRGLIQQVPLKGRRAAAAAALSTFGAGHSAAWAVLAGWRVLDYWTAGKKGSWSVALAGTMP